MIALLLICGYAGCSMVALLVCAAAAKRTSEDWSEHLSRHPQALTAARQYVCAPTESQTSSAPASNAALTQ